MPCSDGYNPPCDMNELLERNLFYNQVLSLKNRNDEMAKLLCMLCRHSENKTMPTPDETVRLANWWKEHRQFDEDRRK